MQYSTDNVGFTYKTSGEILYCIDFLPISINFIRTGGDFPVCKFESDNMHCFYAISTCVPK